MSEKDAEIPAELGHEVESIHIKPLIYFFVWLGLATAIVCLLMWVLFGFFRERAEADDPPPSPLAEERQSIPPQPRLQLAPNEPGQEKPDLLKEHPLEELKSMRADEEKKIKEYNWIDEKAGVVRLPIERAKELLLERGGLPARGEQPQPAAGEAKKPAESKPAEKTHEKHQ